MRRTTETVIHDVQAPLGLDLGVFHEVLQLKRGRIGPGPAEAPRLYDRYVTALEALVNAVEKGVKREA
jgi:hypothetical protein